MFSRALSFQTYIPFVCHSVSDISVILRNYHKLSKMSANLQIICCFGKKLLIIFILNIIRGEELKVSKGLRASALSKIDRFGGQNQFIFADNSPLIMTNSLMNES